MRFPPKSEEEIQSMSLIQPGIYDFEVTKATDKVSKSGREMIEIQLTVWDINGKPHTVYDYLMEAMAYKLRHFAQVGNILDKYDSGFMEASDCVGISGKVEIIIQKGQQKPDGSFYFDKNSVKDYITTSGDNRTTKQEIKEDEIPFSDELPF